MIKEEIFQYFADYIHKHTGITYHESNDYGLESRLNSLAQILSLKDVEDVYRLFRQEITPEMHELVTDLATNNETCFFRDGRPFNLLTQDIIPELMKKNSDSKKISIWSAACSTGQEPYSILMTLKDKCPALNTWEVILDATDISPRVLKQARDGAYTQLQVQRGLPIMTLQKYFTLKEDGTWVISNEFRTSVDFVLFNLLNGTYSFKKYDIIFCRNILIYQNIDNRKVITEKLYDALAPGGYLILGNGESLLKINDKFDQKILSKGTVFQKPDPLAQKMAMSA